VPRYDVPKAAPQPLRLVQLFVNTSDDEHGRELLGSAAQLGEWLADATGTVVGRPGRADLDAALELREALRELLRRNNGLAANASAVEVVNGAARAAVLSPRLDSFRSVTLETAAGGVAGALGRIVAVALAAMLDGSWSRLKACRQCGWGYYDYSRNRSARWCSMSICGNRSKTKAYRRRRTA
jgi:predicted RNA-binding Zn ribbon-like protein